MRCLGAYGPPVVLLHGLFASGRYYGAAYDALAADHQLIVPDLPGFGRSTASVGTSGLEAYGDAVARCLAELAPGEPAVLVGHSFGCLVAIDIAHRHPGLVSALVLFGPPLYRDAAARDRLTGLGWAERWALTGSPVFPLALTVLGWLHPCVGTLARPDLPGAIVTDALRSHWRVQREAMACLLRNGCASALRTLAVPVTAVYGERDRIPDPAFLAEVACQRAMTVVEVPGADHHVLLTRSDACLDVIRSSSRAGQAAPLDGSPRRSRTMARACGSSKSSTMLLSTWSGWSIGARGRSS